MSVLDRFGKVVKAEWNHLRRGAASDAASSEARAMRPSVTATMSDRRPEGAVVDVDGALRVLELSGSPSLDEVRAQYRRLARRYHPKTQSAVPDEAHAARVVIDALTDALELLEEHLMPLPG